MKAGDSIDLNGLLEKLVDKGFDRTDFVYEPGQFALRGGILDIYSFGNEKPYRVELFGNDVDSIRIFDPETQMSERKLLQVNIIPNVDNRSDSGEKISLLEFIPEGTVIWMQDWTFTRERLALQEEDLGLFLDNIRTAKELEDARRQEEIRASGERTSGDGKVSGRGGPAGRARPPLNAGSGDDDEDKLEKKEISVEEFVTAQQIEEQLAKFHVVEFGPSAGGHLPPALTRPGLIITLQTCPLSWSFIPGRSQPSTGSSTC